MVKILLLSLLAVSCFMNQSIEKKKKYISYPETHKVLQQDDYHGTLVNDPYRWLEDIDSKEVVSWTKSQNEITNSYLDEIPFIDEIERRLKDRWNYARMSTPFHKGGRYFYYKNTGLQNHSLLSPLK